MTIPNTPQQLGHSPDVLAQRQDALLQFVRDTLPELMSDNQLDLHKLKAWLDEADAAAPNEHYELTWAGKTDARREVQKTTSHTLRPSADNPVHALGVELPVAIFTVLIAHGFWAA
jgi:adenine-specific DNA-methyltransferase